MVDDKGIWKIEWEKDIGIKEGGMSRGSGVAYSRGIYWAVSPFSHTQHFFTNSKTRDSF